MSYRIEYQYHAFLVPTPNADPRYIVAVEGGDNNCYETRTGRRTRDWDASVMGTQQQVLKQAVYAAGSCEGGMLKPKGRDCTPEAYIARIRRLLGGAQPRSASNPWWYPDIRIAADHEAVAYARNLSLLVTPQREWGTEVAFIDIADQDRALVFDLLDRYPDLPAYRLVKVRGLPAS